MTEAAHLAQAMTGTLATASLSWQFVDGLGWIAAALTLGTFVCSDMRRLRLIALAANAAFIAYGALSPALPVLVLHLSLVPVNLWRLRQTRLAMQAPAREREAADPIHGPSRRRGRHSWRARGRAQATPVAVLSSVASATASSRGSSGDALPAARSVSKAASPNAARHAVSATVAARCSSA